MNLQMTDLFADLTFKEYSSTFHNIEEDATAVFGDIYIDFELIVNRNIATSHGDRYTPTFVDNKDEVEIAITKAHNVQTLEKVCLSKEEKDEILKIIKAHVCAKVETL